MIHLFRTQAETPDTHLEGIHLEDLHMQVAAPAHAEAPSYSEVHRFGSSVANLGDLNGDGHDDLASGTQNWRGGWECDGQVFVLDGYRANVLFELRRIGDDILFLRPTGAR